MAVALRDSSLSQRCTDILTVAGFHLGFPRAEAEFNQGAGHKRGGNARCMWQQMIKALSAERAETGLPTPQ